ncbi:hypothetical protein PVAND_009508 [Polypedilum vanderplanki]|uniref:Uncharacterized protein n=1 Tax=Polypedilum vanderplanki TaxID=319348 RepID=A0A9J6CDH1_POLVA|nr:hypothetical protein PVAND_009508 [Polypedilum vanderplanki]
MKLVIALVFSFLSSTFSSPLPQDFEEEQYQFDEESLKQQGNLIPQGFAQQKQIEGPLPEELQQQPQVSLRTAKQSDFNNNGPSLVRYVYDFTGDGYKFTYELSDGTIRSEVGAYKDGADSEGNAVKILVVQGAYSYVANDGETYWVNYFADENGYKPETGKGVGGIKPGQDAEIDPNLLKSLVDLLKRFRNFKKSTQIEKLWKKYLTCDPIPDTKVPSIVRNFIYKFHTDYDEYCSKHLNWWVKCDERSLLIQDINVPDTRRLFIRQIREPTGKFYDKKLNFFMRVYESLEETLRKQKVSDEYLEDLKMIRDEMREIAFKFLDALTLDIIKHIDREMNSMTPLIANYTYASRDFIKFIWSFKDVTLPKNREKQRKIIMQPLNMIVTMSKVLDLENICVRAMWFKRDIFSDYCPSFLPPHKMEFQNLLAAIDNEMIVRTLMRNNRIEKMRKARTDYELKMEEIRKQQEEEEAAKKNSKKEMKEEFKKIKKKIIKMPVEPPIVDESTYVDVEEEYVEYENLKAEEERNSSSPQNLNLHEYEVNMRDYQILGGIFKIECLERPTQTKPVGDRIFIRINELSNVLKYQNFTHLYKESKLLQIKDERMSMYFSDKILEEQSQALAELTKVEIVLSDKIVWFEAPTVCRWEKWEDSEEFHQLDSKLQNYNLNYDEIVKNEQEKLFNAPSVDHYSKRTFDDFQIMANSDDTKIKLSDLIKHYLIPIMPEEFLNHYEKLELFENKQKAWRIYKEKEALKSSTANDHKEIKSASIEALITIDEFLKHFEKKHEQPKNLFPKSTDQRKIEVEQDVNVLKRVKEARKELRKAIKYEDIYNSALMEIPLKNEPTALSEFLNEIEEFKLKMIPIFKEIRKESEEKVEVKLPKEVKKGKKAKLKLSAKERLASVASRKSLAARRSTRFLRKIKKSSTSITNSSKEELSFIDNSSKGDDDDDQKLVLIPHFKGKWTTKDIYEVTYEESTKTLSFYTGKYGIFAFPTRKYLQLPFKSWECYPIITETERFVVMTIETQYTSLEFKITIDGFTFKILKPGRMPIQEIHKPIKFYDLKKLLISLNINIFPEVDASHYIDDNIIEKHHAMEFHTYKSIATFGLSYHFKYDKLNSIVNRRQTIINYKANYKPMNQIQKILITPLRVLSIINRLEERDDFGESSEQLPFEIFPHEQEFYPDPLTYLKSEVDKNEQRHNQKSFMVMWYMQTLFQNLRPLSFTK